MSPYTKHSTEVFSLLGNSQRVSLTRIPSAAGTEQKVSSVLGSATVLEKMRLCRSQSQQTEGLENLIGGGGIAHKVYGKKLGSRLKKESGRTP